jgi:hypothetical protein
LERYNTATNPDSALCCLDANNCVPYPYSFRWELYTQLDCGSSCHGYMYDVNGILIHNNEQQQQDNDNANANANVYNPGVDFCWEDKTATKPEPSLCWLSLSQQNCIPYPYSFN